MTDIAASITEVAAGIYRLRLPLPFPTQSVNAYMVTGSAGVDLVDTGDEPRLHGGHWAAALAHLGITPVRVRLIYVTHHHNDHLGGARHLQELRGAPVFVLDRDLSDARRAGPAVQQHRAELGQLLVSHGMPPETVSGWLATLGPPRPLDTIPELTALQDGQIVRLGDDDCQVIWAPGHCDGQYCLYNSARRLLFGADHLLQRMVPPMLQGPGRRPDLVGDYLQALARVARLPVDLVLPGHGGPFGDLPGHARRMRTQVQERLDRTLAAITRPGTAYEILRSLNPQVSRLEAQRYLLADLLSYLEYLVAHGRLTRSGTGTPDSIVYGPVRP